MLWCSHCHLAKYCSNECQKKDWNNHREFCKSQNPAVNKKFVELCRKISTGEVSKIFAAYAYYAKIILKAPMGGALICKMEENVYSVGLAEISEDVGPERLSESVVSLYMMDSDVVENASVVSYTTEEALKHYFRYEHYLKGDHIFVDIFFPQNLPKRELDVLAVETSKRKVRLVTVINESSTFIWVKE